MAAILPYLETEPEQLSMALGDARSPRKLTPESPLSKRHTELSKLAWARSLIAKALEGRAFSVEDDEGVLFVRVSPGIPADVVPWHKSGGEMLSRFQLFSTNSKMRCPTFDLPSGVWALGGSCPAARWGQSTVDPAARDLSTPAARFAADVVGHRLDLNSAVCGYCVAGDTLVMVRGRGLCRIGDLVELNEVSVWSGTAWRATRAVATKVAPVVEVVFEGGRRLRCTADHRVMTTDGEVEAQFLIPGEHQILPVLPTEPPFPNEALLPACAQGAQHFNEVRGELPTHWSRDVGVWLGYMLGNGSFYEASAYPTLSLVVSEEDADDLRQIAATVTRWTGSTSTVVLTDIAPNEFVLKGGRAADVAWRTKTLTAFARSLGLSKQGEISTPSAIWAASREGVAGYLSGLFSTDGSVARGPTRVAVSFANTSRRLCEEVQQLLFAFGVRSNICEYTSNARRGYKPLWKVDISASESVERFEAHIGFFNARKRKSLREGLAAAGPKRPLHRPITVQAVLPQSGAEPVYDLLDVGEEHQFLANGVPVHNCYASGGKYGEVVVQFAEAARYAFVRSMMSSPESSEKLKQLLSWAVTRTLHWKAVKYDASMRHGLKPVRVHSSGDFFSLEYAELWMDVARRVAEFDPAVRFWAPTRTHVLKKFAEFWATPGRVPPNFVVRPSAYHIGDAAPRSAGLARGTSVLDECSTEAQLRRGDGRQRSDGTVFDFQCGVYALAREQDVRQRPRSGRQGRLPGVLEEP